MELVDANTKNYVFLTLSQYNNEQNLVRTRVSMRRDQPFWDGGNSYICCESFRITASPSQGGLYYKHFPYEWYMGCELPQNRSDPPQGARVNWEIAEIPGTGDGAHQVGQFLVAKPITIDDAGFCEAKLSIWGMVGADPGALQTNDPRIVRQFLDKFCNHYFLGNKAWIKLVVRGADDNADKYVIGRLEGNPSHNIVGNGMGPDNLYYPDAMPTTAALTVISLNAIAAHATYAQAAQAPVSIAFKPLASRGTAESGTVMSSEEYSKLITNLGTGLFMQCRTKTEQPREWEPMGIGVGGMFQVTGITGVEYNFQKRFFVGNQTNDQQVATCTTAPLLPMQYSSFEVNALCWIKVPVGHGTYPAGTYYGTIEKIPSNALYRGDMTALNLNVIPTLMGYAYIKALPDADRADLAVQVFLFSTTAEKLAAAIHTKCRFKVEDTQPQGGAPPFLDTDNPLVAFAANRNHQKICIRRPDKYIYTPNEMFYAFNFPESVGDKTVQLPFAVQTDENGGFAIWWDASDVLSESFVISVELAEAMGLNQYFEYDDEEHLNDQGKNLALISRVNLDPAQQANEPPIWVDHKLLSINRDKMTPVTLPVAPEGDGSPLHVWVDKVEYLYMRGHQFVESQFQAIKRKIYPSVLVDVFGTRYYRYDNLPVRGTIRNTQQVSVESFSTYSEITIVVPNLPFQSMLGTNSDERILASLRLPFENGTNNGYTGAVSSTTFSYYGDLIFNTLASRSYLKVTTDQALYDCDVEVRLIRRDGQMDVMQLPYQGEFQVKLRLLQTQ